ncbi:MAG: hypothetical protein M1305_06195 [Candidatus Marsarchaeota archaeon]|nr:hypothetical protein [Candidatus Marsarchaeota archaeon]
MRQVSRFRFEGLEIALPAREVVRREVAITMAKQDNELDFNKLTKEIAEIEQKLAVLSDLPSHISPIGTCQQRAGASLTKFEREMRVLVAQVLRSVWANHA